ncbi:MAG: peptide chain release factor N(5)-glutamine methyltransferase [Deltaproteobacteria bacterium]|jgi:release factor glutamine methyltransferase|nr:peptide chain release factor N(5)-glutamine methyltransferase [Deltaproteobacteria bacterium]
MTQVGVKTWTIAEILKTTADFLGQKNIPSPRLEAEILLARVLNLSRVQLYVNFERTLLTSELDMFREFVRRRSRHEPTAYILGEKEFYQLTLKVNHDTLIPRPETEHLIDEALRLNQQPHPSVLDVGTGSGAIALAIAHNIPGAKVLGLDISLKALEVAKLNREKLNLKVSFQQADLLSGPLEEAPFDFILANLPYVPAEDIPSLPPDILNYEPLIALDGGPGGISLLNKLLEQAPLYLKPNGYILLEIHPPQLTALTDLALAHNLTPLPPVSDYANLTRIFVAKYQP